MSAPVWPLSASTVVILASLSAGCADPAGRLDEYEQRVAEISSHAKPGECGSRVTQQVDGKFFFAIAPAQSRSKPLVMLADLTTDADGLHMHLLPLAKDRVTPVAEDYALDAGPYRIGDDGAFVADLPVPFVLPAESNPTALAGEIHVSELRLTGTACDDFLCGTVKGEADIGTYHAVFGDADSSFTMERIPDTGELPEPPQINCQGDLAAPVK